MEGLMYGLNVCLMGIVGFFLKAVYDDLKQVVQVGNRQQTLIELLQQRRDTDRQDVDKEIAWLKLKLTEMGQEMDDMCERLESLEDNKMTAMQRIIPAGTHGMAESAAG